MNAMPTVPKATSLTLLLCLVLFGCEGADKVNEPQPNPWPEDVYASPREDLEAETAALWLSGALAAPESLYHAIKAELATIRAEFRNVYPIVDSLAFHPPWIPGEILIGYSPGVCDEIRRGVYHDWDDLNAAFVLADFDTLWWSWGSCVAMLSFERRVNPKRLAEYYMGLRGVSYAEANVVGGDGPNVYPWEVDGMRTYLFRNAWGDCPCGCTGNEYWYFRVTTSGPVFVGHQLGGEEPEWWEEASQGMHAHRYGGDPNIGTRLRAIDHRESKWK